jgi:2-keto-3-deoxy-L-rhamnonate aldolase RhmA
MFEPAGIPEDSRTVTALLVPGVTEKGDADATVAVVRVPPAGV